MTEELDLLELKDRYEYLVEQYILLSKEIAHKLEVFGRYRKELEYITNQFSRAGSEIQDSEKMTEKYEKDLQETTGKDGNVE